MLFVIGLALLLGAMLLGITRGDPLMYRYNKWDRIAQLGILLGALLMAASLCIFLWGLLP